MSAKADDPEHRLSHWTKELFERILLEPCWATAQDHSGRAIGGDPQKQMNWRAKQTWYGVKPSQLDWRLIQSEPFLYGELELKYGDNKPDAGQETTMRLLRERSIPTGCAWTILQVYQWVKDNGFRLHGNAENIAREIEERWRVADMTARGPQKPKRASSRPRTQKPTQAQLKRVAANYSRGLRY